MGRRRNSGRRRRGSFGFLYKLLSTLVICAVIIVALTLFFRVGNVVVTGQQRYTAEEIAAATGVEIGDNLYLMDKNSIADALLEQLPDIETLRISRKLPDTLMVILLSAVMKVALGDMAFFGKLGSNMISLFIVFALLYWVSTARLVRGQILTLRQQEYVLAAKAAGAKGGWIIRRHLLPNCIGVLIVSTALQIPGAIFTESYLSFLGLGVNAPMPSLGSLAADALNGINSYPYRLVIPAVVISLIVLSLNLLGDGLRDAFDPKIREGR